MKKTPIRLGPLMILLLVISIALTTLALLTVTTSRADRALAERFAASVSARYGLERDGSAFAASAADGSATRANLNIRVVQKAEEITLAADAPLRVSVEAHHLQ